MLALRRNLVPWRLRHSPARPNFDSLFETFFNDTDRFGLRPFGQAPVFNPTLDVSESETEVKVIAELPGLDEQDINVSLTQDILTISGEKKVENEDKGENYHHIERSYGAFKRSVALPAGIEADQVEAIFKNGVLTITLPKSAEAQEEIKRIEVKAS